ncbi:hypothetical protein BM526_04550 [Alteromonas mediterranea]|uniref:hypothetical protein n=1 Tax=Alteromonas mediterranea TaxID=314275 RepID=UPI000903F274|nr:hypothetical protein [Alteromonas mediterranea]APE01193.1 hypothetical protein BM526_04550 [Alteromonas mediterranea]
MKNSILNHCETPPFLQAVNTELAACLSSSSEEFSTERFRYLSQIRHKVVVRALSRLEDDEKTSFAQKEITINQKLEELAQGLLDSAKKEAVKFSRGRAAVKKYK